MPLVFVIRCNLFAQWMLLMGGGIENREWGENLFQKASPKRRGAATSNVSSQLSPHAN